MQTKKADAGLRSTRLLWSYTYPVQPSNAHLMSCAGKDLFAENTDGGKTAVYPPTFIVFYDLQNRLPSARRAVCKKADIGVGSQRPIQRIHLIKPLRQKKRYFKERLFILNPITNFLHQTDPHLVQSIPIKHRITLPVAPVNNSGKK